VRERRNGYRRGGTRGAAIAASLGWRLWMGIAQRPVDSFAILGAAGAALMIIVNAVFRNRAPIRRHSSPLRHG